MDPKELEDKAARLLHEARQMLETAKSENRNTTTDEDVRWKNLHDEAMRLRKLASQVEMQENAERQQIQRNEQRQRDLAQVQHRDASPALRATRYREAFDKWLRRGLSGLTMEQRQLINGGSRPLDSAEMSLFQAEQRFLGTGDGIAVSTYGGRLVPEDFQAELVQAMAQYNGILRNANSPGYPRIVTTGTGAALPWPTVDDTANVGELLAEESAAAELDVVMGQKTLNAYTYSSKIVRVQVQLLQDSAIPIGPMLQDLLAKRLGRITATHFTTGTGSSQPQGLGTGAPDSGIAVSAATGVAGGTDPAAYERLIDLQHTVDPDYRENSVWMFNDGILQKLRKLKDNTARNVMGPAMPPTLLNKPYVINQKMENDGTTGNTPIVYGDLSYFVVRMVKDMTLLRLEERYAEYLQVGFLMFMRADSEIVTAEASGGPITGLVMDA